MNLFSDAHEAFRARVRRFVEEYLTPNSNEWERERTFPRGIIELMGREGLLGLGCPLVYGGSAYDFGYSVVFVEELPRSRMMGLTLSIIAQSHFFSPLLARLGTEFQKREYLAPAIRGEKIGALASTEPSGGTDIVNAINCVANDAGDYWVISGEKKYITNGPVSDFVVVLARTKEARVPTSLSLIIVPSCTPGFHVKETLRTLGLHTSSTGWLVFEECRVPKSLTLGKPHCGYFYATQVFIEERLIGSACALAFGQLVLDETIHYVRNRSLFGAPLAHLQSVRHRIVEMATELEMARRFTYSLCESYREGKVEAKEINMLKLYIPPMLHRIVGECLQLHGGDGFLESNWISRVYRDMRFFSVGGGPSEAMKDLVAGYLRL